MVGDQVLLERLCPTRRLKYIEERKLNMTRFDKAIKLNNLTVHYYMIRP